MSDSGRQIGDCEHGETRRVCRQCLQARVQTLEQQLLIAEARGRAAGLREAADRADELDKTLRPSSYAAVAGWLRTLAIEADQ